MTKITSDIYQGDQTDHFKYLVFTNLHHPSPKTVLFLKLALLGKGKEVKYQAAMKEFFQGVCTLEIYTERNQFETEVSPAKIKDYNFIFVNPPVGICNLKNKADCISWGKKNPDSSIAYFDKNHFDQLINQLDHKQTLFFYQYVRAAELTKIKESIPAFKKLFETKKVIDVIVFPNCLLVFFSPTGIKDLFKDDFYKRLKTSDRLR